MPGRGEHALEDLGLAAHVELRGRLVEQHDAGALLHRAQRAGQRDALPLPAREVGAARVRLGQDRVEVAVGEVGAARGGQRGADRRRRARRAARRCCAAAARSGRSPGTPRSAATRHASSSSDADRTPSISIVPDVGSYRRHSSLASVVLPAPFWPTIAIDVPAGIVRSKPSSTGARAVGVGERHVAEPDLLRARRAGDDRARRRARRRSTAASSRASATTGAAAPSSAQFKPPNAIDETPIAACTNTTTRAAVTAARRRRRRRATRRPARWRRAR